jgi:tetratricopeptide (TPR) repeat protein
VSATLGAVGTYAGIEAQLSAPPSVVQTVWMVLASVIAAGFAALTAAAGGYAFVGRRAVSELTPEVDGAQRVWGGVPPRNPHFTNRHHELDLMRRALDTAQFSGELGVRSCVLSGLGGVGKSSLAAEFAHRHRDRYRLVWWIRSEGSSSIAEDAARLVVALTGAQLSERADVFTHLHRELAVWQPWLLIFDNAKDLAAIREAWPGTDAGHVIITSRAVAWSDLVNEVLVIGLLTQRDAVSLLRRQTRMDDDDSAAQIADTLGRLPLALVQAAAYVTQTRTTLAHYVRLIEERLEAVLTPATPTSHSPSLTTTWSMSVAEADAQTPGARDLLAFCSYLAPESIPRDLLPACATWLPRPLSTFGFDEVAYDLAVAALVRYSLIAADSTSLSVHRLIQFTMRTSLSEADQESWSRLMVNALSSAYPAEPRNPASRERCSELTPHVIACAHHLREQGSGQPTGELVGRAGVYLSTWYFLTSALETLQFALDDLERTNGRDSLATAIVVGEIAQVQYRQANLTDAIAMAERVVRIRERHQGTRHHDLIRDLWRLGVILLELSRLSEAQTALERALAIAEEDSGTNAYRVDLLGELSSLYRRQGRFQSACDAAERALELGRGSGSDAQAAIMLHTLALALGETGEYSAARDRHSDAIGIFTRLHGGESFEVLKVGHALALALIATGDLGLAREHAQQAVAGIHKMHGGEHPDLAAALRSLGLVELASGKLGTAVQHLEHAVAIYERFYNVDHPYVAEPLIPLASAYLAQGKDEQAERCLSRASAIVEECYGTKHPAYAYVLDGLSALHRHRGDRATADSFAAEAAALREQARHA